VTGRRGVVAAIAGFGALLGVVAACGEADEVDADGLARAVPVALLEDHPELVTDVVCPEPIERGAGITITCAAQVGGTPVELDVTQIDDDGAVRVTLDRTLLDVEELSAAIAQRLSDDVGVPTAVVCAEPVVRVLTVGDTIACDATDPDDRTRTFVATILDEAGNYELVLE
jgi:hypothetical protein